MLELKIPPPAVALFAALAMWLATSASGILGFMLPGRLAIAITLAVLGIAISMAGFMSFRRAGTTVNPTRPDTTSSLVEGGVYRFTRNPMYLGLLLVLGGWAAYLSNAAAFAGPVLFALYINRFQIVPEERALAARFGTAFDDYRHRTRRWL
ncbi:MAG: isoprenylcysteine carboxylmethyltransferase family protein [Reyranella sp.]|nr:isoprenylcysteine carboxylmethyltransferase family protein [Reyranella sp.]